MFGVRRQVPAHFGDQVADRSFAGATGVHEAIYSLLMLKNGFICESANIEELDPAVRRHADPAPAQGQREVRNRPVELCSASAARTRRSSSSIPTRETETMMNASKGLMQGRAA